MTFEEVNVIRKKVDELEGLLQLYRDSASLETKEPINEALKHVSKIWDTTHAMDKAIEGKGC